MTCTDGLRHECARRADGLWHVSRTLHADPELAYEEHRAAGLLTRKLQQTGFQPSGHHRLGLREQEGVVSGGLFRPEPARTRACPAPLVGRVEDPGLLECVALFIQQDATRHRVQAAPPIRDLRTVLGHVLSRGGGCQREVGAAAVEPAEGAVVEIRADHGVKLALVDAVTDRRRSARQEAGCSPRPSGGAAAVPLLLDLDEHGELAAAHVRLVAVAVGRSERRTNCALWPSGSKAFPSLDTLPHLRTGMPMAVSLVTMGD
ncbi:hypothetical protein ACFV0B_20540 [Streptomyces xanthophaeus]|uniref:hypothetical protein n=1 Tax=Streptomyces xanthophaeus TaxID=67385 RepID=UPI0036CDDEF4